MSDDEDEKRKKFLEMIKDLSAKINDADEMRKAKNIVKIGDEVKFAKMLSEDHTVWFLPSKKQLDMIKDRLGSVAEVTNVEKHFRDKTTVEYFLDVQFDDGSYMRRINSLCFEKLGSKTPQEEPDFEWI